jgi:hypothetical protein
MVRCCYEHCPKAIDIEPSHGMMNALQEIVIEQLLVGVLLLAPLVALLPTTLIFQVLLSTLVLALITPRILLLSAAALLCYNPLPMLALWALQPVVGAPVLSQSIDINIVTVDQHEGFALANLAAFLPGVLRRTWLFRAPQGLARVEVEPESISQPHKRRPLHRAVGAGQHRGQGGSQKVSSHVSVVWVCENSKASLVAGRNIGNDEGETFEKGSSGLAVAEYELRPSALSLLQISEPVWRRIGHEVLCKHPVVAALCMSSAWPPAAGRAY